MKENIEIQANCFERIRPYRMNAVSYTHLDVYKRQPWRASIQRTHIGGTHEKVSDDNYLIFQNRKGSLGLCTMFSLQKYTSQYPILSLIHISSSIASLFIGGAANQLEPSPRLMVGFLTGRALKSRTKLGLSLIHI